MTFAAVLAALIPLLAETPTLIEDVKAIIAEFENGGAAAANAMLAKKFGQNSAALEQALKTPLS